MALESAENCPPHDMLKVLYWRNHVNTEFLPEILRSSGVWDAVENHHEKWHSDRLSAAIARQFFDSDEYVDGELDTGTHFFIPVYETKDCKNGVIELSLSHRKKLHDHIRGIYEEEYRHGGDWEKRANRKVNQLLQYFPADTWTPFASLAAHHIMTWILHLQDEVAIRNAVKMENGVRTTELCILMFRVPEAEFYKLKEIRRFYAKRDFTLERLMSLLHYDLKRRYGVGLWSVRVGDELVTVIVDRHIRDKKLVDAIFQMVYESQLQCIIKLIRVPLRQELSQMRDRPYWVVTAEPLEEEYAIGVFLEEKGVGRAEWEPHLYRKWVAWFSIEPRSLTECSRYFIENHALKVMEKLRRDHRCRFGKEHPRLRLEASPDLILSVILGYQSFLEDVKLNLHPRSSIVQGFSRSLFVVGVDKYQEVFSAYDRLLKLLSRFHIPVSISVAVTDSKFPFWKVLEIFKEHPDALTIMPKSGISVSLSEKDFQLMQALIPVIGRVKRSVWINEVVPASARSLEELEFELRRLCSGAKRKMQEDQMMRIFQFARRLNENHENMPDEKRREVRYAAFKRMSDFAGTGGEKFRKF